MTAHKKATLRKRLAKRPEDGAPPNQRAAGQGHSHPTIPEPGRETAHKTITLRKRLAERPECNAHPTKPAAGLGHSPPTIPEQGRETAKPRLSDDGRTLTVRVPLAIRQRGGRKLVLAPDSQPLTGAPASRHIDSAMVKAIARAFRWREMLENGDCATIREIASAEKINESYVGRVLRLTLLAPEIIEAIVNGRQPAGLQLDGLMRRFPVGWTEQLLDFSRLINTCVSCVASGQSAASREA